MPPTYHWRRARARRPTYPESMRILDLCGSMLWNDFVELLGLLGLRLRVAAGNGEGGGT